MERRNEGTAPARPGNRRRPPAASHRATEVGVFIALYLLTFAWAREVGIDGPVLVWYPPAALAVAATILHGIRAAPVIFVAEILTTWWLSGFATEFGPIGIVVNAAVLSAAYAAAGELFRRLSARPALTDMRDLGVFLFSAAMVASTLAALAGVFVQVWVGVVDAPNALSRASLYWVGDAVAIVALTPIVLLAVTDLRDDSAPPVRNLNYVLLLRAMELLSPAALALLLFALTDEPLRFLYFTLLPTAAVSLRRGIHGAALSAAATVSIAVAAAHDRLPSELERTDLQLLLGMVALAGLVLGAIETSKRSAEAATAQLSEVVERSPDLIASMTADGQLLYLNPAGRTLLSVEGLDQAAIAELLAPQLLHVDSAVDTAIAQGSWSGEQQLTTADGRVLALSHVLMAHRDAAGKVERFSAVCRDLTDRQKLEAEISRQAMYDEGTGLPNRILLAEQLARTLAEQGNEPGAVLLVDLARFAVTNESFGFHVGDVVLQGVARRLQEAVAPDLVARYGGDVFAVVHPHIADEVEVGALASRLLDAVSVPFTINGRRLPVTAHIGIVVTDDPRMRAADYLRNAEAALNRAKRSTSHIAIFDPEMDRRAHDLLELEIDLRAAIADGSWRLAYQPVLDLVSGRAVGCEALLRWTHPQRGPINPLQVVAIAETTGIIHELGEHVLARACTQAAAWAARGIDISVAVNASAHQLDSDNFPLLVEHTIRDAGLDPGRVVIEITETALAARADELDVVERLRNGGCKIALDDFGTGYSSLARLRELPIDIIKIDRAFVTPLGESRSADATIEAIVAVGHALGLTIVAEGVETEHQATILRHLHCDRAQGYLFAKPMEPDDFERWLETH